MPSNFKKTKLALIISSLLFCSSLILATVSIDKVINLKPGESINVDNLMITCNSQSSTTVIIPKSSNKATNRAIKKNMKAYKDTRNMQAEFCSTFYLPSDKEACLAVKAKYLEPQALELCKTLYLPTDKLQCLRNIKDKVYADNEIKTIKSMYLPSDKLNNLKNLGLDIDSIESL